MDSEQFWVYEDTAKMVNQAKEQKKRVCSVGTTVMRAMESSFTTEGMLKGYEGWTNKFIFPPYKFHVANSMISTFSSATKHADDDEERLCWT